MAACSARPTIRRCGLCLGARAGQAGLWENLLTRFVRLREQATRLKSETWQAIDAEIKEHPAPKDSDSKALSRLILGKWESPRHDYLYRADGTWTMLPADPDTTHGTWRIDGNQYFDTAATDPPQTSQYTIILISSRISCLPTKRTFFMRCALNRAVVLASCQWMRNLSGTSEGRVDIHRVLAEDVLRHGLTARRDSAI